MTSPLRTAVRVVGGSVMVFAGVSHLTFAREPFQAQVPDWVPVDEDLTVLGSGLVEIGLGAGFAALPRRRRLFGGLLAAFFVAIFPGNIAQYRQRRSSLGLDTDRKRFVRLFFQPLMVAAALYGGGVLGRRDEVVEAVAPSR